MNFPSIPHIFIVLSDEHDTKKSSWCESEIFSTGPEWAFTVLFLPFTEFFQILISLSSPHEITLVESALNNTSLTAPLCPVNLNGLIWGLKFQTYTIPSMPPDTTCFLYL